jgi:hypothetical protein
MNTNSKNQKKLFLFNFSEAMPGHVDVDMKEMKIIAKIKK